MSRSEARTDAPRMGLIGSCEAFFIGLIMSDPAYAPGGAPTLYPGIFPEKPTVLEGEDVLQRQYISGDGYTIGTHTLWSHRVDEFMVDVTPETLHEMSQDPKIHKGKRIRINGVLTDDLLLAPGATEEEAASPAEYKKYVTCMQFCERCLSGINPIWKTLEQMLDCAYEQGHSIAEVDYELRLDKPTKSIQTEVKKRGTKPRAMSTIKRWFGVGTDAPTTGDEKPKRGLTILQQPQVRLMPKQIKVKPFGAVLHVVDMYGNVLGMTPGWGHATSWNRNQVITRDKFLVYVNNPTDDDPRGNSAFRPLFWAWQFKNFIPKQYLTYLLNEAVPVPVLELPEGMQSWIMERDSEGNIIYETTGSNKPKMLDTVVAAERTLKNIRSGKGVAIPPKSKLTAYGGNRGGSQDTVFPNAIHAADEQIEEGFLLQPLAQSAGSVQSKSASSTHENRLVDLFFWDKRGLCVMLIYDLFAVAVRENLGEDWLIYLPKTSLGDSEKRDWARDLEVVSKAYFYGFIDDTQRAELCAWLSLPKPGMSRQEQQLQMGLNNPQGAQPGKDGAPAPPNKQRPDKQPGSAGRNDGNGTPTDAQFEEQIRLLEERVRNADVTKQGFSTLGNHRRGKRSFVGYGS